MIDAAVAEMHAESRMTEQDMPEKFDRWDALDQALLELDERAMVFGELDGFIAGLLVCPETIPPGEWFARVVGLSSNQPSPFVSLDHANDVLDLVMRYYDDVAEMVKNHPERYHPNFFIDEVDGAAIWQLWTDGFAAAIELRPQAFEAYFDAGDETKQAMYGLMTLIETAHVNEQPDDKKPPADIVEAISNSAPDTITDSVATLLGKRPDIAAPTPSFAEQPNPFAGIGKVGRNEPCPCGSGKKYKRCCGLN